MLKILTRDQLFEMPMIFDDPSLMPNSASFVMEKPQVLPPCDSGSKMPYQHKASLPAGADWHISWIEDMNSLILGRNQWN